MVGQTNAEIERPRGAPALIDVAVLHHGARVIVGLLLGVADFALVLPLISGLHVHAVNDLREGQRPDFSLVLRRGVATLPVVSAAVVVSWLVVTLGFVLIIPGVILLLRWAVVAQAAALGEGRWRDALRRSRQLTRHRYRHVFGLLVLLFLIDVAIGIPFTLIFGRHPTAISVLVRLPVDVFTASFLALGTALLYFDLKARLEEEGGLLAFAVPMSAAASGEGIAHPTGNPLDPASYSNEDRPPGWYVDPDAPWVMRYWAADGKPGWSKRSTKTPKKVLAEWQDLRFVRQTR